MSKALGHVEVYDTFGNLHVSETLTCAHCQRVYPKPMKDDPVGFCHMCHSPVCLPCGKEDKCDPFEKKLLRMEKRDRMLRSMGI